MPVRMHVISTPRLVLFFSNAILLLTLASAETPEGLKNATISHRQRHRVARRLGATPQDNYNSYNLAGAAQYIIPGSPGNTFNAISGQWIVPDITYGVSNEKGQPGWAVIAEVGIDGTTDCPQFLKAGTSSTVFPDKDGNPVKIVLAFAQWSPGDSVLIDVGVSIGDKVQVSVKSETSSQGTVELINLTTGRKMAVFLNPPSPEANLCGRTADWVVEDAKLNDGSLSQMAKFEPFNFESCAAGTAQGLSTELPGSSFVTMIDENQKTIATPRWVGNTALTVTYDYEN